MGVLGHLVIAGYIKKPPPPWLYGPHVAGQQIKDYTHRARHYADYYATDSGDR